MKRSALKRKTQMPKRRKPWRVKPKQVYKEPGRLAFRVAVLEKGECVLKEIDPEHVCAGPLDPNHVIEKRQLKRYGFASELWNPDNGIPTCRRAHERHHNGHRLPRAVLPAEALAFAERLGLSHLIDRLYYGEDPSPEKEKDQSRC